MFVLYKQNTLIHSYMRITPFIWVYTYFSRSHVFPQLLYMFFDENGCGGGDAVNRDTYRGNALIISLRFTKLGVREYDRLERVFSVCMRVYYYDALQR